MLKFIITVDNIKSGVLFTDQSLDSYNFVCLQMDTFADYDKEVEHLPPTYSAKNDNQEIGVGFILKSMTENQRKIIKCIAAHQLEQPSEKGIKIRDLLSVCIDKMLATSQKGLKEYLNEARDHKIVQERVDDAGNTYLYMHYPTHMLEKIAKGQSLQGGDNENESEGEGEGDKQEDMQ